jgi:chromosome segregation ATPase
MKIGILTALPLLLGLLSGCKSTEEAPDYFGVIARDLDKLQEELKNGSYKIDSVTKSLNKFAAAQGDLRQPLAEFQNSIVDLDSTTEQIGALGKTVKTKEAAFQSSWKDEIETIESANVRRTAGQGRADIRAAFTKLEQDSEVLGTKYREWESKVKQIQTSLEADLSPGNQTAQLAKVKEVNDLTPRLKENIREFSTTLESLSASMKSAR